MNTITMTNEEICVKIDEICNELTEASEAISKLSPVTHKSKSMIGWSGGIIGAILDWREEKRLVKLMNAPIYKDFTFYTFAFNIMRKADELSELQVEYQKRSTKDDAAYYGNVKKIISAVLASSIAWNNYSPDLASALITVGDQKNVALDISVDSSIKESFKSMDLPEDVKIDEDNTSASGCMGAILLMFTIPIATFLVGFYALNG